MASLTQKMKKKHKRQLRTSGKARKRKLAEGTTPRFPIHVKDDPTASLPQPTGTNPDEK